MTEAIRRRPYAVILLDEIEKAHPDVFNVLLQVLDDGRLTDGKGRTVDFKNTVIIMTSNIGSGEILDWGGDPEQDADVRQQVMGLLRRVFKPEFLNRVDEIVIFHPLGRRHLYRIIEVQLGRLQAMLAERQITLELTDAAKELLASEGFDPTYGARPLKRALQNLLQNPLALKLLDGTIRDGQTVRVDVNEMGDAFTFTPVASAAAAGTTAGVANA